MEATVLPPALDRKAVRARLPAGSVGLQDMTREAVSRNSMLDARYPEYTAKAHGAHVDAGSRSRSSRSRSRNPSRAGASGKASATKVDSTGGALWDPGEGISAW